MRVFWLATGVQAGVLAAVAAVSAISLGSISLSPPLAFLLAMPGAGWIAARLRLRVSKSGAFALATVVYLASVPALVLLERWQHPQDLSVLVVGVLLAGMVLAPLGAVALKVLNAAAWPVSRRPN